MEKKMSGGKKLLLILLAAAVLGAAWTLLRPGGAPEDTDAPEKQILVTVVHGDGTQREFPLTTRQETLGRALVEGAVVEENQEEYGLFIRTADGETADGARQEWWCLTKGGEAVNTGADQTPIAGGERYELTLMTGY